MGECKSEKQINTTKTALIDYSKRIQDRKIPNNWVFTYYNEKSSRTWIHSQKQIRWKIKEKASSGGKEEEVDRVTIAKVKALRWILEENVKNLRWNSWSLMNWICVYQRNNKNS